MNSSVKYYNLTADEIYIDVNKTNQKIIKAQVEGIDFLVYPNVYPSHQFRTTSFVLRNLKDLIKEKKICDMGCGPGIVGLFALYHGAKYVTQVDINPSAIKNAKENNILYELKKNKIQTYLSNCFDNVPKNIFDIIVFNMPYHSDKIKINDPLKHAFYDPDFLSIRKFLHQARNYSHSDTKIFIAFSNKGNVASLEKIFTNSYYEWDLWKITNTDQKYDNRIYLLSKSITD